MEPPGQMNWLQVSALTQFSEVNEAEGNELESEMTFLLGLVTQDQAFEHVFPGEHEFDGGARQVKSRIKESLAPTPGGFA
jgi:hypothetical protein